MLFNRSRDPYYRRPSAGGCFGFLLAVLVIAVILIICAIYIGIYILAGLLIIGAVVGGVTAVFSLFKAFPQTVKDTKSQIFYGNKMAVLLKKAGYFLVSLAKSSIGNDLQYAKNAFQKFAAQKTFSFSKWVNFALAVTVLIFGSLILLAVLSVTILIAALLLILAIVVIAVSVVVAIGIGFLYNMFLVIKGAILSRKRCFSPMCFKFKGRCRFADLLSVPETFIAQMGRWIGTIWTNSMKLLRDYKSWLHTKPWIWFPLSVAFMVSCPISALIFIAISSIIMCVAALPVYLINAIWIVIKALFRF